MLRKHVVLLLSLLFFVLIFSVCINICSIVFFVTFQNLNVTFIARPRNLIVVQCFFYYTMGFFTMQAVVEFALLFQFKKLRKVITYCLWVHIHSPKSANSRCIDKSCSKTQIIHFGKRGGMLPLLMLFRNRFCFKVKRWFQRIDHCGFPYSGMPCKHRNFVFYYFFQSF